MRRDINPNRYEPLKIHRKIKETMNKKAVKPVLYDDEVNPFDLKEDVKKGKKNTKNR